MAIPVTISDFSITHIRLEGGAGLEHITRLWWLNHAKTSGDSSLAEVAAWIEDTNGKAFVPDPYMNFYKVEVVKPDHGAKFLRTSELPDGIYETDLLLALPRR